MANEWYEETPRATDEHDLTTIAPVPATVHMLIDAMHAGLLSSPAMKYATGSDLASAVFTMALRQVEAQLLNPHLTVEQRIKTQEGLIACCEQLWRAAAGVSAKRKTDDTTGEIKTSERIG